jgi:hypothetical protein
LISNGSGSILHATESRFHGFIALKGFGRDQTSLCLGRQKIPWSYYLFEALILGIPSTRMAQNVLAADIAVYDT